MLQVGEGEQGINGAVVRALASHQCGPGSNPGVDAICGLSLSLVLSIAPTGFSPGTPVFPSPEKPTVPNSNSTTNQVDEEPLSRCATSKSLFIYLLILCCCLTRRNHCCCITRIINYLPLPIMIARAFNIVKLISS